MMGMEDAALVRRPLIALLHHGSCEMRLKMVALDMPDLVLPTESVSWTGKAAETNRKGQIVVEQRTITKSNSEKNLSSK